MRMDNDFFDGEWGGMSGEWVIFWSMIFFFIKVGLYKMF